MNYIILDLEWDSAYCVKYKRFVNQILQIGAVKLDEQFNIIDTFEETIKSSISKKVTKRFENLTGITTEKMLSGIQFETAVDEYNSWIGNDTITMTWSNSDLYSILENEDYLLKNNKKFKIDKYLDVQKFVQGQMRKLGYDDENQISLSAAADYFNISTSEFDLHTAKDDSLVCVSLLKKCYEKSSFEPLIQDTSNPEFFERLRFKPYNISDIYDSEIDKKQLHFDCDKCGNKSHRITPFKYRNRWFDADFECEKCGRKFNGRVSFKKTYDGLVIRRKIYEIKNKSVNNNDKMFTVSEKM